ncbi:uncharacterized protein LOC134272765 [Saccostrea cucullata]|uniref:uncharacterized protein LOC134272765 n=1 Tax=Saccostrea cuccullata TaxID=36930 RepID=UPI002ED39628
MYCKQKQKSPESGSSSPVKQLLDEPETVNTIDTGYGSLYNVACLSDEKIWTSGLDNTMKLSSINLRSLLKSITTKSGTSSGDLLVIMDSDGYPYKTKVVCYSGSREKQTIQFDDKGSPLYSSGPFNRYITENRNLDICVSDIRAVVVVNQAGNLRFRFTGHPPAQKNKPFTPRGITTDNQGGQFLCYIACGLSLPHGLCTDTNDNLVVAQHGYRQVKKIKYLK